MNVVETWKTVICVQDETYGTIQMSPCRISLEDVNRILMMCGDSPINITADAKGMVSMKSFSDYVEKSANRELVKALVHLECLRPGVRRRRVLDFLAPTYSFPSYGFVYLILDPVTGLTKIGMTKRTAESRLDSLKAHMPSLKLIRKWYVKRPRYVEKKLHRKHASQRSHGEWFSDIDANLIEQSVQRTGLLASQDEINKLHMVFNESVSRKAELKGEMLEPEKLVKEDDCEIVRKAKEVLTPIVEATVERRKLAELEDRLAVGSNRRGPEESDLSQGEVTDKEKAIYSWAVANFGEAAVEEMYYHFLSKIERTLFE